MWAWDLQNASSTSFSENFERSVYHINCAEEVYSGAWCTNGQITPIKGYCASGVLAADTKLSLMLVKVSVV